MEQKKWTDYLNSEVYNRLASCRSIREDILPLAKARWAILKNKKGYVKEDALVFVLELLDCNSCDADLSRDEYYDILYSI